MDGAGRTLVMGDDGSEAADGAWLWISEHDWSGWRIEVLSVDTAALDQGPISSENAHPHPWQPPSPRVLLRDRGQIEVVHLTADGDPRVVINRLDSAGLLVIGHRGRGALKALTLGSTADWLLHRPPAPLAIIRSARPTRRVLLCVDGSADAREATRVLAAMPWIGGATVVVLSVDDGRIRPHGAIQEAQAVLQAVGAEPEPRIRESLGHSVSFNVRSTVLELLEGEPVDLVVLGARGLGLGHHILRGSTAAAVAHHAPCSVLVARADDADDERP